MFCIDLMYCLNPMIILHSLCCCPSSLQSGLPFSAVRSAVRYRPVCSPVCRRGRPVCSPLPSSLQSGLPFSAVRSAVRYRPVCSPVCRRGRAYIRRLQDREKRLGCCVREIVQSRTCGELVYWTLLKEQDFILNY